MKKLKDEFYTSRQLADLLKVHVISIRRYIHSGKLPAVFLGKEYRVKKEDFEKFLNLRKVK